MDSEFRAGHATSEMFEAEIDRIKNELANEKDGKEKENISS